MIEALLFTLDLLVITYACWLALRASKKPKPQAADFKLLAYRTKPSEEQA